MKLPVLNIKGKSTGREVSLDKSIFGLEVHEHAIYLAIKHFRANNRQGTSKAKERGEITGSTRKIKKQKGTGTARAGSIKNPLFKGGGRIFGPKPRSYETKLNKKVKNLAQFSALSGKAKEKSIVVVEDFDFNEPKTKNYTNFLLNLGLSEEKTMLVLSDRKENISLSSRNLPKTNVVVTNELNTYDILNSSKLIFVESALKNIKK
ncbi:MAG: 50S ribosomal protein L4 [Flavobacteriales bacterium]|nr:50S ribosomal protein L4 [Flavobacteriales bacterium]|tara:strand:+ start:15668 stop:16285 length:618 start_codon:yes stop_codon:yes gene_type:complete